MPRRIDPAVLARMMPMRDMLTPVEAAALLSSWELLAQAEKAGWIAPTVRQHRLTRYRTADVRAVSQWISEGHLPGKASPPPRTAPADEATGARKRRPRGHRLRSHLDQPPEHP